MNVTQSSGFGDAGGGVEPPAIPTRLVRHRATGVLAYGPHTPPAGWEARRMLDLVVAAGDRHSELLDVSAEELAADWVDVDTDDGCQLEELGNLKEPPISRSHLIMRSNLSDTSLSSAELRWETFLQELDAWISVHGDAIVPRSGRGREVAGSAFPLGEVVADFRTRYRRGMLSTKQISQLERRPGWQWRLGPARAERTWNKHYADVRAYVDEQGSDRGLDVINPTAARWLRRQRDNIQELDPERASLILQLGPATRPAQRLDSIAEAWLAEDHTRSMSQVTQKSVITLPDGTTYPIGVRVRDARYNYACNELTSDQIKALEKLQGWTWTAARGRPRKPTSKD